MKHLLRKLALRLRAGFGKRRAAPHHRRIRVEPLEERSLLAQLVNVGTETDVVYNLPASASVVFLEEDGTIGNGELQLRSTNGTFDTTTFNNPSGSLTINRGNSADTITISALPDFTAGLVIGSVVAPLSAVNFAGSLSLTASKSLGAYARTVSTSASITTTGGSVVLSAMNGITVGGPLATAGGALTLNADSDGNGIGTFTLSAAALHTFAKQSPFPNSEGASGDRFGQAVAISADGSTAIIGAMWDDVGANTNQGSAYVFAWTGMAWRQQQKLLASDGKALDWFGQSVALSSNGSTAIVGSRSLLEQTGTAYVFVRVGTVWSEQQQLGSGEEEDGFGAAVSLSGDGNTALVGGAVSTPLFPPVGSELSAFVFTRVGNAWSKQQQLPYTGAGGGTLNFGYASLSGDGKTALVRAAVSDSPVYVYVQAGGAWSVQQQITIPDVADSASGRISLSFDGNTAIVAKEMTFGGNGTNSGLAFVFTRVAGVWSPQQQLLAVDGSADDGFGSSVALSDDGNIALVGANLADVGGNVDQGAAYLFTRTSGVWTQKKKLVGGGGQAGDRFGGSVALSGNGNVVIVGAGFADVSTNVDQGAAFSFTDDDAIALGEGPLTITAADVDVRGSIATSSSVSIASPAVGRRPIDLGTATAGSVSLDDAELDRIAAGTLTIGDSNSGAITINAEITRDQATNITLRSTGKISFAGGSINTAGGNLLLTPGSTANVDVSQAGTDINLGMAGTVSFTSGRDLAIAINGTAIDTQYNQLNVVGKVDLTGVDLALSRSYAAVAGETFTIVNNNGADAITGTFNGLPEGKIFSVPANSAAGTFQISYRGGDGNDVVLTAINTANPTLSGTPEDDIWLVKRSSSSTLSISLNGAVIWSPTFSSLTGLSILGLAGSDTLNLDLSTGNPIPGSGIVFDGGTSTAIGDTFTISGNSAPLITYNYTGDGSGTVQGFSSGVSFKGLEQLIYTGTTTFTTINLPTTGPSDVVLGDDGVTGNSLSRLTGTTIPSTTFSNPQVRLTIARGNVDDTFTVNSLPDFTARLEIGRIDREFATVTFAGDVTLGAYNYLSAYARTIGSDAKLTAQAGIFFHAKNDITLDGSLISGGAVSLVADSDGIGSGVVTLSAAAGNRIEASNGNILVAAADVDIQGPVFSSGSITFLSEQAGRSVNLGTNTTNALSLSVEELQLLSAEVLQIGSATSGDVTVSAAIDLTANDTPIPTLQILTGGAIVDDHSAGATFRVANLDMIAPDGIGTVGNPLEIDANILTTDSGNGDGSQFIVTAGDLTIGVNGLNARSGQIHVSAGTFTAIGPVITAGGVISLSANAGITLNNTLTSGGGEVQINADSDSDGIGKLVLASAILDSWKQQIRFAANDGKVPNAFGYSVAISEDGSTAVIGAPGEKIDENNNQGSAYIFTRIGNTWAQQQKLTVSDVAQFFGASVAVSGDGTTVLVTDTRHTVGANSGQGSAYIFTRVGSSWIQQQQISAIDGKAQQLFGQSVSLSVDGNTAILGTFSVNEGAAYVFTRTEGAWTQQQTLLSPGTSDFFGLGVALSGDGEAAFVSAPSSDINGKESQGSVYVFTRVSGVWTNQQKLVAIEGTAYGDFGRFMDISSDGNTAVISAAQDDSAGHIHGTAYVFIRDGNQWAQQVGLVPSDSQDGDGFGPSVSISGDGNVVIVGATHHDFDGGADQGAAYLFERSGGAWTELKQLRETPGRSGNGFGLAAISGDGETVIVGHSYDYPSPSPAYIFRRSLGGSIDAGIGNVSIRAADVDLQGIVTSANLVFVVKDENPVTRGPAREQRILGWVTQMSAGPGNKSGQQLSFEVITDKPGLFATGGQPRVGADGTLTFTPKPNARGIANVTVVLHDDGGGTNASEPVTFQVEITKPRRWHNSAEAGQRNGLDVTGSTTSQPDGQITAGDALAVINYINANGSGPVGEEASFGPPYYDVNGDDQVGPADVLKVINYINAGFESEGAAGGDNLAGSDAAALDWILYGADEYFRELSGKRRG